MKHSAGEIMNYVTVDTCRTGEFPFWFHQTWTTSLQLCFAQIILFRKVGIVTIASLLVIVLTVICKAPLAKLQHRFQSKLMVAQDEWLKASSEALVSMKVLKLYAWESHFKNLIEKLRNVEYKCGPQNPNRDGLYMVLAMSAGKLVESDEPMKLMKREGSLFG
ncbi:ABC transporter C family member 10 like [Actinidia chinensis var. chinensis]|uniref:ABC transporter C family member 10 like n=1 Tax=Actinidia chinensis var. chinensis TaxID=1590841 RepID=A0A2R6REW6_ACTCC|nr:ABC transporter C family member 10 like [Actinidia chinensis var. chinensis]